MTWCELSGKKKINLMFQKHIGAIPVLFSDEITLYKIVSHAKAPGVEYLEYD